MAAGCLCIECINFGSETDCLSPINVVLTPTETTINVTWDGNNNATQYTVELKESNSVTWLSNIPVTAPLEEDILIGLTPDTEYDIRVIALCDVDTSCISLVQTVKTLPLEEE